MTWQIAIILQIFVSSVMTLYTRRLTIKHTNVFFSVAVILYAAIALSGWVYGVIGTGAHLAIPESPVWPFLLIEGIFIPASWLIQYRLISYIGASNAVTVGILNTLITAILGVILLREPLTVSFFLGALLIVSGSVIALRLLPDASQKIHVPMYKKAIVTLLGALLYSIGMYAEKQGITLTGVWNYAAFGWSMQAVGALSLFILFGQKEHAHLSRKVIYKSALLGIITSIAGALYIYALSKGSLSHTIIATSGKAVIVLFLAAIFLREHNDLYHRVAAFVCAMTGLLLIILV